MRMRKSLFLFIGLLVLVSLACQQSGEILTPEEATARAQEEVFHPGEDGSSAAGATFQPGDKAEVIGTGFLINLQDAPGGRIAGSQSRGSTVDILESSEFEGEIWYHVDSETGEGWLRATSLQAIEGQEASDGSGGESGTTITGPGKGDTVYLVSTGFLVNLLTEPNGRLKAVQERGVAVTIEDVFESDTGAIWYFINAPTGEGWIPAENISVEAP